MDFQLFEKIIIKRAIYFSVICAIVLIVSIFALIYILKNMRQEKVISGVLSVLCIVAITGSIFLGARTMYTSIYDIKNQAYIKYYGDFIISNDVENRSGTCSLYLPNKMGLHLETDAYYIDSGKYTGEVIYSKKSKIVLIINIGTTR